MTKFSAHQQALTTARATGDQAAELDALVGLGHIHLLQCRNEQATNHYQQALRLAHATGRSGELMALVGLGHLHRRQGRYEQAIEHHDGLAHAHHTLHQTEQAHTHWQQALDILTRLDVSDTDDEETTVAAIRAHLGRLDHAR